MGYGGHGVGFPRFQGSVFVFGRLFGSCGVDMACIIGSDRSIVKPCQMKWQGLLKLHSKSARFCLKVARFWRFCLTRPIFVVF